MAFHVWKKALGCTTFQPHWKAFFNPKAPLLAQKNDALRLSARNVVPYVIYINVGDTDRRLDSTRTRPPLLDMIREFGGEYFDVTDEDSLQRAYEAIDERETVRMEVTHRAQRVPIFSRFLLVSMALLVVGIPAGFVAELLWGPHP